MWRRALLCVLFCGAIDAFALGNVAVDDLLEVLVPTVNSDSPRCRNHSLFYVQELKKLKLWATEMFDASSKFPSGILSGSTYDFGNFEECLGVSVPLDGDPVTGKYCMVKFHIAPPESNEGDWRDKNYANISSWDKIIAFSNDRSRSTRNDFHFSYCIPSSCTSGDLQSALQGVTEKFNAFSDFQLSASVNPRYCQLKDQAPYTTSEISFITVVLVFVFVCLLATGYDWLMKLDDLKQHKLTGKKHTLVLSFSLWQNLKKLSGEGDNDDGLQCIHGMKVLSMFLVIMGHRIMFGVGSPMLNPSFVEDIYGKIEASVLLNGPIIVDTFFNISGFLVCYLMLVHLDKGKRQINFVTLYVHRFVRLTPAYAIVLGFYCTVFIRMGSGPLWLDRVQVEQERCIASWWANIFYLNNYINKDQICMFQSWYLTCDMHFFMVAPFIIWLLRKKPYLGLTTLFVVIILSVAVVFTTVYLNEEEAILLVYVKFLKDPVVNDTFKNIYIPTHMRASAYFVGMVTGYLKYSMRTRDYKMPKYIVYMGWIMCFVILEATMYSSFIFYLPDKAYDPLISAIYASMHHVTWSACISWMIVAISEGHGAWLEPLLSWKPLILLSRITYTAFLCHGAIQIYTAATLRHASYASVFNLVFHTAGDITLAYICALVLSMFFEAPIIALEKIILRRGGQNDGEEKNKDPSPTEVTPKIKIINRF